MFLTQGNSEGPLLAKTFGARDRGEGNKEEDFGSECPSLSSLSSVENWEASGTHALQNIRVFCVIRGYRSSSVISWPLTDVLSQIRRELTRKV